MIRYSASSNGFYDTDINGGDIPSDAIDITEDEYKSILYGQAAGKIISADFAGKPVLREQSPQTAEQLTSAVRTKRDRLIAETDYLVLIDYPITPEKLELVKTYRQLLRDITKQPGFPTTIDWPPMPE